MNRSSEAGLSQSFPERSFVGMLSGEVFSDPGRLTDLRVENAHNRVT